MPKKVIDIFNIPKPDDTTFNPDLSGKGFSEKAEYAVEEFVSFEKETNGKKEPITRIEKDAHYLEYGMDCPFKSTCSETIGDKEKPKPHVCKKSCGKFEISLDSESGHVKELITLNEKPDSNEFTILTDSNLDYELSDPIHPSEPNQNDTRITPPEIIGYRNVLWNSGDDTVLYWGLVQVEDSAGKITFCMYHAPTLEKNIRLTINQDWLNNAVFPIFMGEN